MSDQIETYQGLRLQLEECRAENVKLRIALEDHNSGSKQLAKWLEESRLEAMDAKRQAASATEAERRLREVAVARDAAETQSRIDRQLAETLEARALADAVKIAELEAALADERRCRQDSDAKLMGHDDQLNAAAYELTALREHLERLNAMKSSLLSTLTAITIACKPENLKGPDGKEWTFHPPDHLVRRYWEELSRQVLAAIDAARGGGK